MSSFKTDELNKIIGEGEQEMQQLTQQEQQTQRQQAGFSLVQPSANINNKLLSDYIRKNEYPKIRDQLNKAAELYKQDKNVGALLYLYLEKENQEHVIEDDIAKPSQLNIRQIVETALDHNLYILARSGLSGQCLQPRDRDLLFKVIQKQSEDGISGQIKLVTKLLLQGGPLYTSLDQMKIMQLSSRIINLVENSHDKAAQYLVELCKKYNIPLRFSFKIIKTAFEQKSFGFLISYLNLYNLIIESAQIYDLVVQTLDNPDDFIYGVYFLQFISILKLNDQYMIKLVEIIEDCIENKIVIASNCISPQATVSVLCDFVDDLIERFKRYQVRLIGLRDSLKDLAILMMEEQSDALALERMYLKQVLPVRDNLVELYFKKKELYQELLNYDIVADFLQKNFNGKYKSDRNFLISSSALKSIQGQNTQPIIKAHSQKQLLKSSGNFFNYLHPSVQEIDGVHNWFQYGIWKTSAMFRLSILILFYIAILGFVLVISLQFFEEMRIIHTQVPHVILELQNDLQIYKNSPQEKNVSHLMEELIEKYLKTKNGAGFENLTTEEKEEQRQEELKRIQEQDLWEAMKELEPEYKEPIDTLKEDEEALHHTLQMFKIIPFYFFIQWFNTIFEVVNLYKRRQIIKYNTLHMIDTLLVGINVFLAYEFIGKIDNPDVSLLEKIDILNTLEKVQAASLFLMWGKLLVYLKLTQRFGIIIRIIELSLVDIMNFLIILFILMMSFVTLFFILFEDSNDNFSTFFLTVRSATAMILGNFDTTSFSSDKELGAILVIVYMIVTNVLALNLLIAILSTTYEQISERSTVEFSYIVYNYQAFVKSSKRYTGLVCAPAPLNIIVIPFQLLITLTNNQFFNELTLKIIYGAEFICLFLPVFLAINLILVPFAYLYQNINLIKSNNTFKALIKIIVWVFFGLLYQIATALIYDIVLFTKVCMMKVHVRESLEKIENVVIQKIGRFAKQNPDQKVGLEKALENLKKYSQQMQQKDENMVINMDAVKEKQPKQEFNNEDSSPNSSGAIMALESEGLDELEDVLTQHKTLEVQTILEKFTDNQDIVNFNLVDKVINHCKMHKISMSLGLLHCFNYKETEVSLVKFLQKQESEAQNPEDFQKLYKEVKG